MPLQQRPVHSLDDINQKRRDRETLNHILKHEHDDSKVITSAEKLSGVTVVNAAYPPGDLRRYGAVLDGVTDDRPAFEAAYSQFKQGGPAPILPPGTCYVSQVGSTGVALTLNDDVILDGGGEFTLLGGSGTDYTLIYANGGTDVKIDVRGIIFNNNKTSPSRPSDNNDISFRIESDVYSLNIERCEFKNYDNDGIYFRAAVTGPGGAIHHNKFYNGARSAVYIAKGERITVSHNEARTLQLQPFSVTPTNSTTVCRQISIDFNRIVDGGTDTNSANDRAAIYIGHVAGATSTYMGQYTCRGNVIKDFGAAYTGALRALGIEIRECSDAIVTGNEVTGVISNGGKSGVTGENAGLYAYLATRVTFAANISNGNDIGLWMNACTDYTDGGNACKGNLVKDRNYNGPDGATTYLQADGLNVVLARGSVSYSAGAPSFNSRYGVNSSIEDLGTGDARFTFTTTVGGANYSVLAMYRSHSGTSGFIQSASHTTTTFRILTFSGTVASDQNYDFVVYGVLANTTEP